MSLAETSCPPWERPNSLTQGGHLFLYPTSLVYLELLSDFYYTFGDSDWSCSSLSQFIFGKYNLSFASNHLFSPSLRCLSLKGRVKKVISKLSSNLYLPWFQKRYRKLFTRKGNSGRCNLPTSHFYICIHSFGSHSPDDKHRYFTTATSLQLSILYVLWKTYWKIF